jgi:hypothetical protein
LLLVGLHAVEGLQHGLHQLSLGGEQLLQVSVVVIVVVVGLAIALVVPCVHHLMVWEKGEGKRPVVMAITPLMAGQLDEGLRSEIKEGNQGVE